MEDILTMDLGQLSDQALVLLFHRKIVLHTLERLSIIGCTGSFDRV
jgi:hypothetical protein